MLASASRAAADGADMVEFRFDALKPLPAPDSAAWVLERSPLKAVATCRAREQGGILDVPRDVRLAVLRRAVRSRAAYVDIEFPDEPVLAAERSLCRSDSQIIASFHDWTGVPADVADIIARMEKGAGDIIKLAVTPASAETSARLLRMNAGGCKRRMVIGMGLAGAPTRILGQLYGAEFTFAPLVKEKASAPGQVTLGEMLSLFRLHSITQSTRILGVIGNPLGHSLSPLLHNTVFGALGMDAVYLPFEVKTDPAAFVREWTDAFPLHGASVTIPHKAAVMAACARVDADARRIGAANTLYPLEDGGFGCANTDAPAVADALEDVLGKGALKGRKALVLGAGGAARGALYGLAAAGCRVAVSNRTHERAAVLARDFGADAVPWEERCGVRPEILVNMTSVGMYPDVDGIPVEPSAITEDMVVFDGVYNPLETRLLAAARERGAKCVPGTEMFIRQAARQLKLWFGIDEPPVALMRRTMSDALARKT